MVPFTRIENEEVYFSRSIIGEMKGKALAQPILHEGAPSFLPASSSSHSLAMAEVQFSRSPIGTISKLYREDMSILSHARVRPKWKGVNRRIGGKEHIRTNRDQAGGGVSS
jgi:hypothetical protein